VQAAGKSLGSGAASGGSYGPVREGAGTAWLMDQYTRIDPPKGPRR
jgi:hypothetical protein